MTRRSLTSALLLVLVVGFGAACGKEDHKLRVTGLDPAEGSTEGGSYLRVKGNGFFDNGGPRGAKIYFGSRQGSVVRMASDSEIIVEAPGGKKDEKVDVLIIFEPGGEIKLKNGFTFIEKNTAGPSVDQLDTSKVKKE